MAQTPEGKVKDKVKRLLKRFNAYQHWPVQTGYGAACLDCHGCYNGLYFAVETKAPGKKLTARQELTVKDIQDRGGAVFVIGEKVIRPPADKLIAYSGMAELNTWLMLNQPAP